MRRIINEILRCSSRRSANGKYIEWLSHSRQRGMPYISAFTRVINKNALTKDRFKTHNSTMLTHTLLLKSLLQNHVPCCMFVCKYHSYVIEHLFQTLDNFAEWWRLTEGFEVKRYIWYDITSMKCDRFGYRVAWRVDSEFSEVTDLSNMTAFQPRLWQCHSFFS